MAETQKYKLTYFDIRGRAEPIRIMFAVAKLPLDDNRVNEGTWSQLKNSRLCFVLIIIY